MSLSNQPPFPTALRADVRRCVSGAMERLASLQEPDGHWEEFALPPGPSDEWITAYVGLALAEIRQTGLEGPDAEAAARAGRWLVEGRPYEAGWGYNRTTGPDTDSSAYALRLLQVLGTPVAPLDELWLRYRMHPRGGFRTYDGPLAWAQVHADVSPVAYEALGPHRWDSLLPTMVDYLRRHRNEDGTWRSYWWRRSHYTTYWNLRLARRLGLDLELELNLAPSVDGESGPRGIRTNLDLTFALGTALLQPGLGSRSVELTERLLSAQQADGGWQGGADMRVTDSSCFRPWEEPLGEYYEDRRGLFTTASAMRILGVDLLAGDPGGPKRTAPLGG